MDIQPKESTLEEFIAYNKKFYVLNDCNSIYRQVSDGIMSRIKKFSFLKNSLPQLMRTS